MNEKNLESLKIFGTKYFKEQLFKPPPEVIEDIKYGKNNLQVGRKLDGSIYTLDLSEACRMLFVGATRCMPKGTLINTPDGHIPIESCKEVYSYNIKHRSLQRKSCKVTSSGKMKVVQIYILGGGMYECSAEHKWLIYRNNKFKVVETKDLKQKDHLLNPRFRKKIRISKIVFTNDIKEMYDLTVEDNANFELADGTISHNSGKTFFLRSIGDRLVQTGRDLIYLSDVKNEFYSSIDPVQPKFEGGLIKGETPTGVNVVTLRPTFFKTISPEKHKSNFWYSVDMRELSKADFMTMMNVTELTQNQQVSMELIYQELSKRYKENEKLDFSVDMINEIIDSFDELNNTQKTSLKFKFRPLEYSHFFEKKYKRNVVSLIRKGYVPAINVENFDSFGKGAFLFPEVTLNIVLREVITARRSGKIKPVWVVLDEASRFVGNRKRSSLKESILQSVDLDTRYNVNYIFASQIVEDVPDTILKQSKYIFIPATADVQTIKFILVNTGLAKNIQTSVNESMKIKRMMKKVKFSWIVINRMTGQMDLIRPLAPLSHHLETSK